MRCGRSFQVMDSSNHVNIKLLSRVSIVIIAPKKGTTSMNVIVEKLQSYSRGAGAILLICGTTIGGGMLALPLVSAPAGYISSTFLLSITWIVMTFTAFLLLECTLACGGKPNLISMSRKTLGPIGECIAWIVYLLLLYALITAYIVGASSFFSPILSKCLHCDISLLATAGFLIFSTLIVVVFGIKIIDGLNRPLLIVAVFCFFIIVYMMFDHVTLVNLSTIDLSYMFLPLPVLVTAFGFHIIIPSLVQYLNRDVKLLRICLFLGSLIPLIIYLVWQTAIAGALPLHGEVGIFSILNSEDQLGRLNNVMMQITANPYIYYLSSIFSIFAILTSLLGVSLSLWDFFIDGFSAYKWSNNKIILIILTFAPPIWLMISFPQAFINLLGYAGIFVSILLGIFPIMMCWKGRKLNNWAPEYRVSVRKFPMVLSGLFFVLVIIVQLICGVKNV